VESVAAYWREYGHQRLLVLNNLSAANQFVQLDLPGSLNPEPVDLISGLQQIPSGSARLDLELKPYEYRWLLFDAHSHPA
jgi:hypothetical protein